MDRADHIDRRKRKYMAQILEAFEQDIEPLIDVANAGQVQAFKGLVRHRINALATEARELVELGDGAINAVAVELRDALSPVGRP